MAYPELRLAVEYDGQGHLTRRQQEIDMRRLRALNACGWFVMRFNSTEVLARPDEMADEVWREILRRRRRLAA